MPARQHLPLARLAICWLVTLLISACGTQSSNAPPPNAAEASPPPAPAAAPQTPPGTPAPANAQQNASVAELLSGSNAAPAAAATAPPAADANVATTNPSSPGAVANAPVAADSRGNGNVEYARVISVQKIPGPRQICTDQTVVERRRPEDRNRVAGTVIGAIAGGIIGHQIGGGRGRTVATVGGAVAGGAIGRKVQGDHQDRDTVTRVVKHCRPATESEEQGATLYDVVYAYQGQNLHVRLDYDPGDRIELPVRGVE